MALEAPGSRLGGLCAQGAPCDGSRLPSGRRSGQLVERYKQACSTGQLPCRVVAAELTPSRRDLLLFCQLLDHGELREPMQVITVQVGRAGCRASPARRGRHRQAAAGPGPCTAAEQPAAASRRPFGPAAPAAAASRPTLAQSSTHPPAHTLPPQVLNLEAMAVQVPRIDVLDHSGGAGVPAYAVSDTINTLGTEYLFVGLGAGVSVHVLGTSGCQLCAPGGLQHAPPCWRARLAPEAARHPCCRRCRAGGGRALAGHRAAGGRD